MAFKSPPPGRGGQNQAPLGPFPVPDQPSSLAIDLALALGGLGSGIAGEPSILGAVERRLANLEQRAQEAEAANIAQGLQREAKAEERQFTLQRDQMLNRWRKDAASFDRKTKQLLADALEGKKPPPVTMTDVDRKRLDDLTAHVSGFYTELASAIYNPSFSWPKAITSPDDPDKIIATFNSLDEAIEFLESEAASIKNRKARGEISSTILDLIRSLRTASRFSSAAGQVGYGGQGTPSPYTGRGIDFGVK